MVVAIAARSTHSTIALGGGCFQNVLLAEETLSALRERGYKVRIGAALPPGDGGLALGQAWVAAHELQQRQTRGN
jgi:hydrogenase maturation protein HypF